MENKEVFYKMENSGLTKEEIGCIKAVFPKYTQIEVVLLYGSRAMGNFKPASDIDLTLVGKDIDLSFSCSSTSILHQHILLANIEIITVT